MFNPFKHIYNRIKVKFDNKKIPSPLTIDKSGIIKSDYPTKGNGWIKGWVLDTPNKDIIIVCKHSNPSTESPNNKVYVRDNNNKKHSRKIVKVYRSGIGLDRFNRMDLDIAICKLNKPFPDTVMGYKFAKNVVNKQVGFFIDQYGEVGKFSLFGDKFYGILTAQECTNSVDPGDSGTPWFVWENKEWRVCSHTNRRIVNVLLDNVESTGPWYSYPDIYKDLIAKISSI